MNWLYSNFLQVTSAISHLNLFLHKDSMICDGFGLTYLTWFQVMEVLMTLQGAQMEDDDPTISYMLQVGFRLYG